MQQPKPTRFDYAQPSAKVTRAIVIRGKGRFAIVRPDRAPSVVISRKDADKMSIAGMRRTGGVPLDTNAKEEFEAGMQFGVDRAA